MTPFKGLCIALLFLFTGCATSTPAGTTTYVHDTVYIPKPPVIIGDTIRLRDTFFVAHTVFDTVPVAIVMDTATRTIHLSPIAGDNWANVQGAINYCQAKACKIELAPGIYHFSRPLLVVSRAGKDYTQSFVDIEGPTDARNTPAGQCAWFMANFTDAPLFVLQQAKGATIRNLMLTGGYTKSASFTILQVDTLPFSQWLDDKCANNRTSPYAGICIDPFSDPGSFDSVNFTVYPSLSSYYLPGMSKSGSTAVNIENCYIAQFTVGVMVTPSWQANGEMIDLVNSQINNCVSAYACSQAQSKDNIVDNCMFWGGVHTIIDGLHWGFYRPDAMTFPYVSRCNIAGANHQFVCGRPINFQSTFDRIYAESLFKLGDFGPILPPGGGTAFYTRSGVVFQNCMFDFQVLDDGYPTPDFYVQGEGVVYTGTTLRLYNGDIHFGRQVFDDNLATFRDGVFGKAPIIVKTDPMMGQGSLLQNMRNYNNGQAKLPDSGGFEIQQRIGSSRVTIDRTLFTGYILDPSHQTKIYDVLLTKRANDEPFGPNITINPNYVVGSVYAISGDTVLLRNMGMGWHTGDSCTITLDRLKPNF